MKYMRYKDRGDTPLPNICSTLPDMQGGENVPMQVKIEPMDIV